MRVAYPDHLNYTQWAPHRYKSAREADDSKFEDVEREPARRVEDNPDPNDINYLSLGPPPSKPTYWANQPEEERLMTGPRGRWTWFFQELSFEQRTLVRTMRFITR